MLFITLILCCMMTGSLACSDALCLSRAPIDELRSVGFLPDEEHLEILCPKLLTFVDCENKYLECLGQTREELASFNQIAARNAKAMLGGFGVIRDVCDKDSSFHSEYVASVSCYREYFNGTARNCRADITKPVEDFFDHLYADINEDEITDEMFNRIRCLKDIYELVCIIEHLGDDCGIIAQRQARDVLERTKDIFLESYCSNILKAADLKTKFLDFLQLEQQRKNRVQEIFDLLKRRR